MKSKCLSKTFNDIQNLFAPCELLFHYYIVYGRIFARFVYGRVKTVRTRSRFLYACTMRVKHLSRSN